ncbi:hypothetical protein FF1_031321 [Malus domestica]
MLTVKLQDDNFVKWNYQFQSVLRGYDFFEFFTGESPCPPKFVINTENGVTTEITAAYKSWVQKDMALLSLLIATLSDDAMEYVIGCKTSHEAWVNLQDRYASVSRARINQLKIEFHTIQKGSDSVDKYLLRLKAIRDQLVSAGERITDNDVVISALSGLPSEFDIVKAVVLARETSIPLKDFRAQLIGVESTMEARVTTLASGMAAMYVQGDRVTGGHQNSGYSQGESSNAGSRTGDTQGYQGNNRFPNRNGYNNSQGSNTSQNYNRSGYGSFNNSRPYYNGNRQRWGNNSNSSSTGNRSSWSGNTTFKTGPIVECQICSRRGHTAATCSNRSDGYQVIICQICGKKGHHALDCRHRNNYSYQGAPSPPSLTAFSAQAPSHMTAAEYGQNVQHFSAADTWVLDTGASHHMTSNLGNLNQPVQYNGDEKITIGNGEGLTVNHIGSTTLSTPQHLLFLKNVLHVPTITVNLLSVKKLCEDNHCWFICDESVFFIQDKATGMMLYHGQSRGELYEIPVTVFSRRLVAGQNKAVALLGKAVKTSVWHKRLGHPSAEVLAVMLRNVGQNVNADSSPSVCSSCLSGKMCRQPFPVKETRASSMFDKVHSDIWGPAPVKSLEGFRYYVSFVDEFSRFVWIFPIINKSDVFSVFVKFFAFVTTQFNSVIKCLQTDGGSEYMSNRFQSFLALKGTAHSISCPYTPQQNGLAERKHRHIVETAITLLTEAAVPLQFWNYACNHAVFLINRMPCKVLGMKSPYQILFKQDPVLHTLKIFGSAVYPFLRPYTKHKLQPRSKQCVFLGFVAGYKGVVCYDLSSTKLVLSRHVVHDETIFPFKPRLQLSSGEFHKVQSTTMSPIIVQIPCFASDSTSSSTHAESSANPDIMEGHSVDSLQVPRSSSPVSQDLNAPTHSSPTLSTSTPGTISLLPVHSPSQLEVILPISSPVVESSAESSHNMVTRLKSGAISRRSYTGYIGSFPELQTLQMDNECDFTGGFSFIAAIKDVEEPSTFRTASTSPHWQSAMQEEFNALKTQGTWELVPSPPNRTIIGSKWVYKVKKNPDGSISRYKARLVAQGFSQEPGIDYSETFSPVVRHTTVRLILSLAAINKWELRQLDIKNAFLHGDLQEEVYMKQPQGFVDQTKPHYVCKLIKSLYGLKQAPRAWNSKFTTYLPALGFVPSSSDTSLFVKNDDKDMVILLLYVDDIILTGSNASKVQQVIDDLAGVFDLKDMGRLTYFLGLQIHYKENGDIFVNQSKYVKDLIHKAGMDSCKPANTPCKPHSQMLLHEGIPLQDSTLYRSLVGSLQYLTFTRPDIAYAVNSVCQFMTAPTYIHLISVKRIIRYLQGTAECGVTYVADTDIHLTAFSDADWAADLNTRRSVTGYVVYLGGNPISWQSKKQPSVSRSSTEAEYKALAHTAADVAWIRLILKDLGVPLPFQPTIFCDNKSAIALSANPVYHSRIKHLDTDYHFVRERVHNGDLLVEYLPTDEQTADILTKGLHSPQFTRHCFNLKLGFPS